MNYQPSTWGPSAWALMHILAEKSRSQNEVFAKQFARWLYLLKDLLPCERCRVNYLEHLNIIPIPVSGKRNHFVSWVYKLHKRVNESRNIKKNPSYASVRDLWHKIYMEVKDPYETYGFWSFLNLLKGTHLNEFMSLLKIMLPWMNVVKTRQQLCNDDMCNL